MKKLVLALLASLAGFAWAGDKIYVGSASQIALVDIDAKTATLVAAPTVDGEITDIATDANGALYLLTFTSLYSLNTSTRVATRIGAHGISGANALTFDASGVLYAASSLSTSLYRLDLATAKATVVGSLPNGSSGDLAWLNGRLFLAGVNDTLGVVNLRSNALPATVGNFGLVTSVFGLASGDSNTLYGGANSKLFKVDPTTGAVSYLFDMPLAIGQIYGMANFKAITVRDEDRLMNWAEDNYPGLFAPAISPSQQIGEYYFRYYLNTGTILAVRGGRVIYYQVGGTPLDIGTLQSFLPIAVSAGY